MAKLAQVGYGSQGQGIGRTENGYTYVVNDNVRVGDLIQPIATSSKGRKFVTTGRTRATTKENTAKAQIEKQKLQEKNIDITQVYSGKELGAAGSKRPTTNEFGEKVQGQYVQETRAGNIAKQLQKDPNTKLTQRARETYDEYASKFMNNGGKE